MAKPFIQNSVNAGEFSPALYGRTDLAKYRAGCSTLRNMFPAIGGGAASRAGTLFVGPARQSSSDAYPPQLIPFQYSVDQGYLLVFSNQEMSVVKNGAYVTNTPYNVTSVSSANPGVFFAPGNNFTTGSWVYLSALQGLTNLNGGIFNVAGILTTSSFTLSSVYTGTNINTTTYSAYTTGGTVASIFTTTTPYVSADLQSLKWAQSADVLTITHPSYAPTDLARIADNNWTLTTTSFSASISAPTTLSASGTALSVTYSEATQYAYVVTAINSADGQESNASSPVAINNSVNIAVNLGSIQVNWSQVTGAQYYNVYKATPTVGTAIPAGALYGFAGSAFGLSFVDTNIQQDFSVTPPLHQNPFAPGAIQYLQVTSGGTSYSAYLPPTVTITDGTGTGATAYAIVVGSTVQGLVLTNGGHGYSATPTVSITVSAAGTGFAATAVTNGHGTWDGGGTAEGTVTISSSGSGYTSGTIVTASYPLFGSSITQVAVSLTVGGGGGITAIEFPYTVEGQKPVYSAVTISVPAGSGATATAHVGPTTGTYPSVCAYWQDRRFYADTTNQPDTYFASQPGSFTNMDRTIPTVATDAIIGTPWAQQVNGISDMVPMPGGMVVLTGGGAWQLNGGGGSALNPTAITPIDQQAIAQAYNGISPVVKAIPINNEILYVQRKGSIVRNLSYNFYTNIYTGQDLTVMSGHLFTGFTIERWAWAEEPYKLVWAVRDDGDLVSLTFMKEQDIWAWARHDTNGLFESVAVVTEPPVDAPYFITKRRVGS